MTMLTLYSPSSATDSAWRAASDIADIAAQLGVKYRLVGGISVTLLTHHYGVDDQVPARETADADMGAPRYVCGDDQLVAAMSQRGYSRTEGNRFVRKDRDHARTIDILGPSHSTRIETNEKVGDLSIDMVPGLHTALKLDPAEVDVRAVLRDGTHMDLHLLLPDIHGALVMKSLAYRGRFEARDAADVWRLLVAAQAAGFSPDQWLTGTEAKTAAHYLHQFFALPRSSGPRQATASTTDQARIRLLAVSIVPKPKTA